MISIYIDAEKITQDRRAIAKSDHTQRKLNGYQHCNTNQISEKESTNDSINVPTLINKYKLKS